MNLGETYQAVLMLVLIGMIIGVGVLSLDRFGAQDTASNTSANAAGVAINASRDAIGGFASNWMELIVTMIALAIILTLVVTAFVFRGRQ